MIKSFRLVAGPSPGVEAADVAATPVTVFVGPNNSGKTHALGNIASLATSGDSNPREVVARVELDTLQEEEIARLSRELTAQTVPGTEEGVVSFPNGGFRCRLADLVQDLSTGPGALSYELLGRRTSFLDGTQRLRLVTDQGSGDLNYPPTNTIQRLFCDDEKRKQAREIVLGAIGGHLVIDPSQLSSFRYRLSRTPPRNEHSLDPTSALPFYREATLLESMSDGVRAFVGIVTEVIAGDPYLLLIDEPEAFLHPPLAFKLGHAIARLMREPRRLFASTHSSSFLMGCVQSGIPLTIIRLTYKDGVATSRVLPAAQITKLFREPLLRSTRVLEGLFHEAVVVGEADADRAFYEECNLRLTNASDTRGVADCLFLNAQNKQTVPKVIQPLREMGVPAAAIVDIDVLCEGRANWAAFMDAAFVPEATRRGLEAARPSVWSALEAASNHAVDASIEGEKRAKEQRRVIKAKGIAVLAGTDHKGASKLIDDLAELGIFVVPCGELECWLQGSVPAGGHGPEWLVNAFERMREDPQASDYVRPSEGDVWEFLGRIAQWVGNPERSGMPP